MVLTASFAESPPSRAAEPATPALSTNPTLITTKLGKSHRRPVTCLTTTPDVRHTTRISENVMSDDIACGNVIYVELFCQWRLPIAPRPQLRLVAGDAA
jgi:hypothetical protein